MIPIRITPELSSSAAAIGTFIFLVALSIHNNWKAHKSDKPLVLSRTATNGAQVVNGGAGNGSNGNGHSLVIKGQQIILDRFNEDLKRVEEDIDQVARRGRQEVDALRLAFSEQKADAQRLERELKHAINAQGIQIHDTLEAVKYLTELLESRPLGGG